MPRKALVVDSDFFFVEFLSRLLEERGYFVHKAYDGKQGIAGLDQGPYDIMFADLVMPKVNGRQFFHVARRRSNGRCCPLVALSGTLIEQMEALDEIGADYFIAKGPFEKLSVQLNDFMTGLERRPGLPPAEKKILQTGSVFPRRDAVELLGSLEFQQAVIERLGVGVMIADKDTRILHANPAALAALNKTLLEALNTPILALFPPECSADPALRVQRGRRPPGAARGDHPAAHAGQGSRLAGGPRGRSHVAPPGAPFADQHPVELPARLC
ncbi:MAG: response regulator [Desulfobacterales bacterium]|nr:response regulator [Desulfobacterales bacterium]